MKNQGLQNRFGPNVKLAWIDHHECMLCKMNQWNCLHHIVSPSSRFFKPGKHNESVLNSCPMHNTAHPDIAMRPEGFEHYCHFGNETFLNKDNTIAWLLQEVYKKLMRGGYELEDRDKIFLYTYKELYLMEATELDLINCGQPVYNVGTSCV